MTVQRTEVVYAAKEPEESRRTLELLRGCVLCLKTYRVTHVQNKKSL